MSAMESIDLQIWELGSWSSRIELVDWSFHKESSKQEIKQTFFFLGIKCFLQMEQFDPRKMSWLVHK